MRQTAKQPKRLSWPGLAGIAARGVEKGAEYSCVFFRGIGDRRRGLFRSLVSKMMVFRRSSGLFCTSQSTLLFAGCLYFALSERGLVPLPLPLPLESRNMRTHSGVLELFGGALIPDSFVLSCVVHAGRLGMDRVILCVEDVE